MTKTNAIVETEVIKMWAASVQEKLCSKGFHLTLEDAYSLDKYNLHFCCFKVDKGNTKSKEVKDIIRDEAVRYKDGRLYFMAYNDIQGVLVLLFYSFHEHNDDSVKSL